MIRIITRQVPPITNVPCTFDLFIAASGYEERSTFLAESITKKLTVKKRYCFIFSGTTLSRGSVFKKESYELFNSSGDDDSTILLALEDFVDRHIPTSQDVNILIDYSSMTKVWYSAILRFFYFNNKKINRIHLYFSYSFSKFEPPSKDAAPNQHVSPIEGFSNFSIPEKPTALIIGLGYEKEKAFGLTEFFDSKTFLLHNDKSFGSEFTNAVINNNKQLISEVGHDHIFTYPLLDMAYTEILLADLCESLLDDYRVIIAPCGPKPFTLLSLIVSMKLPNVDVWRISPGVNAHSSQRKPSGKTTTYCVSFSGD